MQAEPSLTEFLITTLSIKNRKVHVTQRVRKVSERREARPERSLSSENVNNAWYLMINEFLVPHETNGSLRITWR